MTTVATASDNVRAVSNLRGRPAASICTLRFFGTGTKPGTIGENEPVRRKHETRKSFDQLDLFFCGEVAEWPKAAVC